METKSRYFIVEINAGENFKPVVYFEIAKSHFEISELVYYRKGENATMDDIDELIQKLPCGTRDTGKESPFDKESYFQEDCLVAIVKGGTNFLGKTKTIYYCKCGQAIRLRKRDSQWVHYGYKKMNESYSDFLARTNHEVVVADKKEWRG